MGIGTTLTFGYIRENTLHLAHVGDSRCYSWRNASLPNSPRIIRSKMRPGCAAPAARSFTITKPIATPSPAASASQLRRKSTSSNVRSRGDRYLFCTDGVTRMVRDEELAELIGQPAEPEEILREMITLAVRRGGPDNATGVLVFIEEP